MREEFLDFHVIKNVRDVVGYAGGLGFIFDRL
jgi:hypothetical protein